jgi:hypothetical protein
MESDPPTMTVVSSDVFVQLPTGILVCQLSMLNVPLGDLEAMATALLKGDYASGIDLHISSEPRFKSLPSTARLGCNQMHVDM